MSSEHAQVASISRANFLLRLLEKNNDYLYRHEKIIDAALIANVIPTLEYVEKSRVAMQLSIDLGDKLKREEGKISTSAISQSTYLSQIIEKRLVDYNALPQGVTLKNTLGSLALAISPQLRDMVANPDYYYSEYVDPVTSQVIY